ncbi:hypothetical protein [Phyllobacterium ifriqiyense]
MGSWGNFDSDSNATDLDTSTGGTMMGASGLVGNDRRLGHC